MSFTSIIFLFLFLPLSLIGYYLVPGKYRSLFLLLFSLFLYTWGDKVYVVVLLYSAVANYFCGLLINDGKRKTGLWLGIGVNLLMLGFFKYYNFSASTFQGIMALFHVKSSVFETIPGLVAPIGISFYTFKTLSYLLDVYKAKVKASRNFIEFATYVAMFPPLVAGPIVRYQEIETRLAGRPAGYSRFAEGIERFITGLAKKMLLANTFASAADMIFDAPITEISSLTAWLGVILFTFQIYYDFSGYSDMAIGLGKMFGYDFPENFNYPYISRNIREFWRRWHMTLSSWFRDYLFLPMAFSLSRKMKKERYLTVRADHVIYMVAILITFLVCGFWHGSTWNFIAWGGWYGLFIGIEHVGLGRILKRAWRPLQHTYTLLVIMLGWVLFRTDNLPQAWQFFLKLFSFSSGDASLNSYILFFSNPGELLLMVLIAALFSTPLYGKIHEITVIFSDRRPRLKTLLKVTFLLFFLALFIVCVSYITVKSYNAFIYERF